MDVALKNKKALLTHRQTDVNSCHKFSNYLEFLPLVLTIFRYSGVVKENVQEVDYEGYYFCGAVL